MNKIKELLRVFIFMPVLKTWRFFITAILLLKLKNILNNQGEKIMIKSKLLTILFLSVLSFSCKREILTPEKIPERTVLQDEPIANLSIPSKDATLKITPVESEIMSNGNKIVYGHFEHYFEFNGKYYITAAHTYSYSRDNKVDELGFDGNILSLNISNFKMEAIKTNVKKSSESNEYPRMAKISEGNAYEYNNQIYVKDAGNSHYYYTSDFKTWNDSGSNNPPTSAKKREKVDLNKVKITANNGKTYTFVYTGGGREFSIKRLDDRIRQIANRFETKMELNPADFNNHHIFDIGLNNKGSTNAEFRLNPTNYIDNNTNYVWIGKSAPHQVWLMPVKKDGKDYLIRFVEHCPGGGAYIKSDLESKAKTYLKDYQKSLALALAEGSKNKEDKKDLIKLCYESISNNINYGANKYFLDTAANGGLLKSLNDRMGTNTRFLSPNKPLQHYVIEIVDIQ